MKIIKLLIPILFIGCTHTTLVVNVSPTENIQMGHSSGLRRGCYKLNSTIAGKAVASMEAHDRSGSRELATMAIVGATAAAGPLAGAVTAAGEAGSSYFDGDKDTDQNCKFEKQ